MKSSSPKASLSSSTGGGRDMGTGMHPSTAEKAGAAALASNLRGQNSWNPLKPISDPLDPDGRCSEYPTTCCFVDSMVSDAAEVEGCQAPLAAEAEGRSSSGIRNRSRTEREAAYCSTPHALATPGVAASRRAGLQGMSDWGATPAGHYRCYRNNRP